MNSSAGPTVLVSWAHRDDGWSDLEAEEWIRKVVKFSSLLTSNGVQVCLDLWSDSDPKLDWGRWGQQQVDDSDLVIIVASNAWQQRWEGGRSLPLGTGVVPEVDTLKELHREDQSAFKRKVVVVLLPGMSAESIPQDLRRLRLFRIKRIDSRRMESLLRRIYGHPVHAEPYIEHRPGPSSGDTNSVAALDRLAIKRSELDEIKSGNRDVSAGRGPLQWVGFTKPKLGKTPRRKLSVWAKLTAGGVALGLFAVLAATNNFLGALKSLCDMNRWSVCSTSTSSPTPSISPSLSNITPQPTLPAGTPPEKLAATYDGTNPSGCAATGAPTLNTLEIKRMGTNNRLATVEIKHAPKCDTTWVRVINTVEDTTVNKVLERRAGDGLPAYKKEDREFSSNFAVAGNDTSYSSQAYAPGCVIASVQITDASGSLIGELPAQEFCWTQPPR